MTDGVGTVDCSDDWVYDQSEFVETIRSDVSCTIYALLHCFHIKYLSYVMKSINGSYYCFNV